MRKGDGESIRGRQGLVLRPSSSPPEGPDESVHVHLLQEAQALPCLTGPVSPVPLAPCGNGLVQEIGENCNMFSLCPRGTGKIEFIRGLAIQLDKSAK